MCPTKFQHFDHGSMKIFCTEYLKMQAIIHFQDPLSEAWSIELTKKNFGHNDINET